MFSFLGFQVLRDGYGTGTIAIAEELRRIDSGAKIIDMAQDGEFVLPEERVWMGPGTAVALCLPDWYPSITCNRLIGYTMFEATGLPKDWDRIINWFCDKLIVPCAWCKDVFEANGVDVPIEIAQWGINPEEFWYIDREAKEVHPSTALRSAQDGSEDRPYTFLWSGTPDLRKGWDLAYRAFRLAFGDRSDMQLVMHFRDHLPGKPRFEDRNVRAVIGKMYTYQWRSMLAAVDAFVFPSRGEGWGLPPREAAATGLPTIATDYGGLHDEIEMWGLPLSIKGFSTAEYGEWEAGTIGEWAEPDLEHLVELMRWCEGNRNEAARRACAASEFLTTQTTWERTARAVMKAAEGRGQEPEGRRQEPEGRSQNPEARREAEVVHVN
jgi:glycosyltransferase involved in cell wall biosynthesis